MTQTQNIETLEDALTHLERLRAELNQLHLQVNQQQRLASLGTITAIIAHEFNNILTPMMAYAQMAAEAPEDLDFQRKAVRKALESSDRASKIASAILSFARHDESQGAFHVEPDTAVAECHIAECVQAALLCLARDPSKDGITMELSIPPTAKAAIDPISLEQVLVNLLLNARRALAASKGGRIRIAAIAAEIPGRTGLPVPLARTGASGHTICWQLSVEDSGCGMSPQMLGSLFTPFRTGDVAKGHGLGLVVSKRLIEAVGGELLVESAVNHGTKFTLVLPAS